MTLIKNRTTNRLFCCENIQGGTLISITFF